MCATICLSHGGRLDSYLNHGFAIDPYFRYLLYFFPSLVFVLTLSVINRCWFIKIVGLLLNSSTSPIKEKPISTSLPFEIKISFVGRFIGGSRVYFPTVSKSIILSSFRLFFLTFCLFKPNLFYNVFKLCAKLTFSIKFKIVIG